MTEQTKKTPPAVTDQDEDLPPRPTKLGEASAKEVFGGKAENLDYMINLGNEDAINADAEG